MLEAAIMTSAFYIAALVAVVATVLAISRSNAVHALLYLVVSLLSVALIFLLLGAPFVAALEVIVYAGAIMVLFVFVVIMLNVGPKATSMDREASGVVPWVVPAVLAAVLMAEFVYVVGPASLHHSGVVQVTPKEVALSVLGTYFLGVEMVSVLLLSALVGAYHLAFHLAGKQISRRGGRES
jgi:NADH-quinone oxidoreductase subunit J